MVLDLSKNCQLGIVKQPSGIPGHETIRFLVMYPEAQHPRWQEVYQVTVTEYQALAIADAIAP